KAFFQKHWPQKELAAFVQREVEGKKIILPIWHEVDHQYIAAFSQTLADKLAISTAAGLDRVATTITEVVISGDEVTVAIRKHPEVATATTPSCVPRSAGR